VCSDDAAAMAQPLAVALHALRRTSVKPGQTCVVIGVGGIGSFILGAAAAKDISPLIAVDIDDQRLRTAQILGAKTVIDARTEDVAARCSKRQAATARTSSSRPQGRPAHPRSRSRRPAVEDAF
jgi:threonine dehydrogenase-like Zn-dependent dehydrogenase